MNRIILMLVIITAFTAVSAAADKRFVNSRKAPLWNSPSFQAAQINVLTRGQVIFVDEQKSGWCRVHYNNQQGWMLNLMLTSRPPVDPTPASRQAVETMARRARRRPSAFAGTAAARGLKDKRRRFSDQLKLDYQALAKMESLRVNDQQALEFLKQVQGHD